MEISPFWNQYLPPRVIRNRGELDFKPGQVWAWRAGDDPVVFRVLTPARGKESSAKVESLARVKYAVGPMAMRAYGSAVLVRDVGQPARYPDDIWQETYALAPDLCYAPGGCTKIRVMGRDGHGKAYCWEHRALWGTVTSEVEDDRAIAAMGRALGESADKIMRDVLLAASSNQWRPKVGDVAMVDSDGEIVRPAVHRTPRRQPVGKIIARRGEHVIVAIEAGDFEFKVAADLSLRNLPDYTPGALPVAPAAIVETEGVFASGTFSNLLAPMKPLTADSIVEAMKTMDAIKARDLDTKKRYDDIVMSSLAGPAKRLRTFDEILTYPMPLPAPKPLSEAEITRLQWAADDGGRHETELFPVLPEFSPPRTQSRSIAAGLGIWGTRGDAKLRRDPPPYPYVSDEDLLPDV